MTEGRKLSPEEFDKIQAMARTKQAAEENQRVIEKMRENAQQQDAEVRQISPGGPAYPQTPDMPPTVQVPLPHVPPTARAFSGGIVAGVLIGGIVVMAIRKAQVTIIPESEGGK